MLLLIRLNLKSYKLIMIENFNDDLWRILQDGVRFSVNVDHFKYQWLVPGRRERFHFFLCSLTLIQEHDPGEWIWNQRFVI